MAVKIRSLIGKTVKKVRLMTKEELKSEGWECWRDVPVVIIFDDGTKIYPSRDPEGNGPGCTFGIDKDGSFYV